jgi:hypothetical protein
MLDQAVSPLFLAALMLFCAAMLVIDKPRS